MSWYLLFSHDDDFRLEESKKGRGGEHSRVEGGEAATATGQVFPYLILDVDFCPINMVIERNLRFVIFFTQKKLEGKNCYPKKCVISGNTNFATNQCERQNTTKSYQSH